MSEEEYEDRQEFKEDVQKDIEEEYKESLKTSDDETLFVSSLLKLSKVKNEIMILSDIFHGMDIDGYEALIRLEFLLRAAEEVRKEIKARL